MRDRFRSPWLALLLAPVLVWSAQAWSAGSVDFQLPGLDGQPVKMTDYRGRWVVLNFWATWCPPCLEEMPELEAFHQQGSAAVIGINFETVDREMLVDFVADLDITYPVALAGMETPEGLPKLRGLPTTVFVSPQGEVVKTHTGIVTAAMLEDLLAGFREAREDQER